MNQKNKLITVFFILILSVQIFSVINIELIIPEFIKSQTKDQDLEVIDLDSFISIPRLVGGSQIQEGNKSVGSRSSVFSPKYDIGESNETHKWIQDPTNQTDGYYIEIGSGYQELNSSRGQTNRHWYNETSNEYTFGSDCLVNKTGVVDETDWITQEEYPNRFIVRLMNGSIYTFETVSEINAFYSLIDNSTVWGVGYESFWGVMAVYLNFQDIDWGHAQLLYYPRLANGLLPSFNQPLYAIYYHLYSKVGSTWYDKILNDRNLYDTPSKNPRNTLSFYNDSDTIGFYYTTYGIEINGFTWDFKHGFKYNITDTLYHMIDEFRCRDRDFDDVGYGYEITTSPQSEGTAYEVDRFVLRNETYNIVVNVSEAWQAGSYVEDFYSQIDLVSKNNETMVFSFADMENAGFTQKYLELHDQIFPNGLNRKVLLAGMYGYGSYSANTIINIDPDVGPTYTADNYDLNYDTGTFQGGYTAFYCGYRGVGDISRGYVAFDTGLSLTVTSTSAVNLSLYSYGLQMRMESGEGIDGKVYAVKSDNDNVDQARENSLNYADTAYVTSTTDVLTGDHYLENEYHMFDATQMEVLTDYWGATRDIDDSYISFYFYANAAADEDTEDAYAFSDTQHAGTDEDPIITFTYTGNAVPSAAYLSGADAVHYAGKSYAFATRHTDTDGRTEIEYAYGSVGDANSDIKFRCDPNSGTTPAVTVVDGSTYLIGGTATSARGGTGDNWDMTWTYTIDWDWDHDDSTVIDYFAYTTDDNGANSGWDQEDLNYNYENELVVQTLDFALNSSAFADETDDLDLNADEWFRGGAGIRGTGTVRYEGASSISPPDSIVNVQLWTDGTDRGDSYDVAVTSGAFTTPYYYTATTSGLDITYALDVTLQNFPTGGSEGSNGAAGYNTKRDNQVPTFTSYTQDADADSQGDGYAPNTNYEDDEWTQGDLIGDDGSGSGIYQYYTRSLEHTAWGLPDYDGLNIERLIVEGWNNMEWRIHDNVGNYGGGGGGGGDTGVDIFYGTTDPSDFDMDIGGAAGYPTDYVYIIDSTDIAGGDVFGDPTQSDEWSITVDGDGIADWGSGGAWKVAFSLWSWESQYDCEEDSSAPYDKTDYNFNDGDTEVNLYIYVINNCGHRQMLTLNLEDDTTDPTTSFSSITENTPNTYIYYSGSGQTVYFSDLMSSTDQLFTVVVTAADTSGSGLYGVYMTLWDDDTAQFDTSSPYSRQYSTDSDETTGSIDLYAYDNVGNYDASAVVITMTEDTIDPSGYSLSLDVDTASIGYIPNTNYYDDDSVDFTVGGTASDSGSGLPTNCYGFQIDSGGYSYQSGITKQYTSLSETNHTIDLKVVDNVGNEGSVYSEWVIVDTDNPIDFTLTLSRHTGIDNGFYAYLSGSTIYFNSGIDEYFGVNINDIGTIQNSGYWKHEWDKNSVFLTAINDTDGPADGKYFYFVGDSSGTFIIRMINNAGNYQTFDYTATEDITSPTMSFALFQDSQALVSNYYHTTTVYTTVSSENDGSSGLPTNLLNYKLNVGSYGSWESTVDKTWTGTTDQSNNTLYAKIRDNVGNEATYQDWVFTDTIAPVLGWLTINESYAPNWFDQSVSSIAQAKIMWTESYPYDVDATCSLSHSDDNAPSGTYSLINFTLTSQPDGSYSVSIRIRDKAGNEDTTLLGSEAPINLESGMSSEDQEFWFYFYYFRSDGIGLNWKDFNTSCVIDDEYKNYTEVRLRGMFIGQKFLNQTSAIRFVTRDYFGNVILNQSYSLPSSRDLWLTLSVNTFKAVNIYDDIINITIEHSTSDTIFTEQLVPYEVFRWDMYASTYTITALIHTTGSYAIDDQNNILNDYQVDLSSYDVAIYIDAIDNALSSVIIVDQQNRFLDSRGFKIYVNSTRIYGDTFFWSDTSSVRNITITDIFDNQLYQDTSESYSRFIDVVLTLHSLKIQNLQPDPVWISLIRGSKTFSEWVFSFEVIEYRLESDTYNLTVYYASYTGNIGNVATNGTTATYEWAVSSDNAIVVSGNTIQDVFGNIQDLIGDLGTVNSTIHSQIINVNISLTNDLVSVGTQVVNVNIDLDNINSSINSVLVDIDSAISNLDTNINLFWADINTTVLNINSTIFTQTVEILSDLSNVNSTIYAQTITLLSDLSNVNTTIYAQTVTLLSNLDNVNSTIYAQTLDILVDISTIDTTVNTIYSQTIDILLDLSNTNSTIYAQTVEMLTDLSNVNSTIFTQTVDILSDLSNVNTTIFTQTVTLLSNLDNVNSTIYAQTLDILVDISTIDTTVNTIYSQTIDILLDLSNTNSTIYAQTVEMLTDISNMNSTIYAQTVTLLSNLENVNTTIYFQTLDILTAISTVDSTVDTIYSQTVDILIDISNTNSTIYAQTITLLSDISNMNSTIYAQTLSILVDIYTVNTTVNTILAQTVDILIDLSNINSTIFAQTVDIISRIDNTNSTIYTQNLEILSRIYNTNVTLYNQMIDVITSVYNYNSSVISQVLQVYAAITNIEPADPNIEVIVVEDDSEVMENQNEGYERLSGEISTWGTIATVSIVVGVFVLLLYLFREQDYQRLKKRVNEIGSNLAEDLEDKGKKVYEHDID